MKSIELTQEQRTEIATSFIAHKELKFDKGPEKLARLIARASTQTNFTALLTLLSFAANYAKSFGYGLSYDGVEMENKEQFILDVAAKSTLNIQSLNSVDIEAAKRNWNL